MNDLRLNEDHDLVITNGDFSLLNSEASVAKQTLKINLLMYQDEWFLDNTIGVPYFQEIFGKITNTSLADNIIQEIARDSYNIGRITGFSSQITTDRKYVVDRLDAITEEGEIISVSNIQV